MLGGRQNQMLAMTDGHPNGMILLGAMVSQECDKKMTGNDNVSLTCPLTAYHIFYPPAIIYYDISLIIAKSGHHYCLSLS